MVRRVVKLAIEKVRMRVGMEGKRMCVVVFVGELGGYVSKMAWKRKLMLTDH